MIFESRIRRNSKVIGVKKVKSFPNTYENPHYKEETYRFSGYRNPKVQTRRDPVAFIKGYST